MKGFDISCIPLARLLALSFAFPGALLLTQCKTGGGKSIHVGRYTQATLRTPGGHGMERKDYPFDASGKYRTDWVKNNTRGKDPSALGSPSSGGAQYTSGIEVASTPRNARTADSPPETSPTPTIAASSVARIDSPPSAVPVPTSDLSPSPPSPLIAAPEPAPEPAPRYHRVASGDTLYSLSRRHSTTVDDIKRINALRGDTIHVGQSLRLP